MKFGSVCSGIEAASVAWHPLGWKAAWLSEIEKFPCEVLKHHYPDVPNLGDMTTLPDRILNGEVEAPNLFCGGTPCQAFSVAGLRQSLNDARGNLSLTFCEIANAIDKVRSNQKQQPSIVFWENVPGVLNTKDNAFGCFLAGLAGEDEALVPPGGRWTNAGFVDGPQRAVAWRVLDAQYFGVAQRRRRVFVVASARADFDPAAVLFEFEGVRRDTAPSRETRKIAAGTVTTRSGSSRADRFTMIGQPIPLDLRNAGRNPEKHDEMNRQGVGVGTPGEPAHTVTSVFVHGVAFVDVGATLKGGSGERGYPDPSDGNGHNIVAQTVTQPVAQPVAVGTDCYNGQITGDVAATMGTPGSSVNASGPTVMQAMQVRRLTPVECERLQGFPDNYTNIKPNCPDGPRYKALGNSWAVPVVRWIGERIAQFA